MTVESVLAKATEGMTAGRAFGPVIERDDCLLVPVAFVVGGGGGGDAPTGDNIATGGGFGGITWPIGAYVIKGGEVRWVPAVDVTLLALGGIFLARTVLKLRAKRRA
jgi:hypothetical protein